MRDRRSGKIWNASLHSQVTELAQNGFGLLPNGKGGGVGASLLVEPEAPDCPKPAYGTMLDFFGGGGGGAFLPAAEARPADPAGVIGLPRSSVLALSLANRC